MIALGVVYVAMLAMLITGLAVSPDHTYRGWVAAVNVLLLFASGLALAIHAL